MKYIYLVISFLSLFNIGAQNLVPNSSFEYGSSYPTGPAMVGNLNNWMPINSPEWHYEPTYIGEIRNSNNSQCTPYVSSFLNAHTGDGYIGFGACEGVQVKLSSKTKKENYTISISLWWTPMHQEDTEINIYLLKDKAPNDAFKPNGSGTCTNPNLDETFREVIPVNAGGTDATHIPGVWYHYQSKPVIIRHNEFEWLLIKGGKTSGAQNSCNYIFVDDVAVYNNSICSNICPGDLPSPTFQMIPGQPNTLVNAMVGNTASNWFMTVENATEIEFTAFSNASQEFYHYHAYDPNGLKDPGYPDYAFEWNGENDNGNAVQFGLYQFNLTIKNCDYTLNYIAQPLFIFPAQSTPIIHPPFQKNTIENCCKPNATFNNITFQSGFREDVDDFISAGMGGPTIVPSNSIVKFYAGNNITLGPGFQAYGDFVGEIVPCGTYSQRMSPRRDFVSPESIDSLFFIAEKEHENIITKKDYEIYPNPSNGVFNLKHNFNSSLINLEITNKFGKVIFTKNIINPNSYIIDLKKYASGVYFIKITTDNKYYIDRLIKQ